MNNYLKGCLRILFAILLSIATIVGWYHWRSDNNRRRADTDHIKFSRICDTLSLVTEKPSVELWNFNKVQLKGVRVYLVRGGTVIRDTLLSSEISSTSEYSYMQLPFEEFLKSDTIVLETSAPKIKHYYISGFRQYAYLHYGMIGYLGSYDCRLDNDRLMINGKISNGRISSNEGIPGEFKSVGP